MALTLEKCIIKAEHSSPNNNPLCEMKFVSPLESFDLKGLLNATSDFHVKLSDSDEYLFICVGTIQHREERYDKDPSEFYGDHHPSERDAHLREMERLFTLGDTIVLPFAEPNVGEPVACADGEEYLIGAEDDDYGGGEFVSAVLLVTYNAETGDVLVATGLEHESYLTTGEFFSEHSIGSLDKPAEEFLKRFVRP